MWPTWFKILSWVVVVAAPVVTAIVVWVQDRITASMSEPALVAIAKARKTRGHAPLDPKDERWKHLVGRTKSLIESRRNRDVVVDLAALRRRMQ